MRSLSTLFCVLAVAACGGGDDDLSGERLTITALRNARVENARITLDFQVVTAKGDPVPALRFPDNFEVFEDGSSLSAVTNRPKVDTNPQNFKVYTLLLVDMNAGIQSADPELNNIRGAVKSFAQSVLTDGNRFVAVHAFDGRTQIQEVAAFTNDLAALNTTLDSKLVCGGELALCEDPSSNLYGAVVQSLQLLTMARTAAEQEGGLTAGALAIFSDGKDRAGRVTYQSAVTAVRSSNNKNSVFAIAFESDQQDLATLREFGKDGFVNSDEVATLVEAFMRISDRVNGFANSNYRLQYCTNRRTGDHRVEVRTTYTDAMRVRHVGFLNTTFRAVDSSACVIE